MMKEIYTLIYNEYGFLNISKEAYELICKEVMRNIETNSKKQVEEITIKKIESYSKIQMERFIIGLYPCYESKTLLKNIVEEQNINKPILQLISILMFFKKINLELTYILANRLIEDNKFVNEIVNLIDDDKLNHLLESEEVDPEIKNNLKVILKTKESIKNTCIDDLDEPIVNLDVCCGDDDFEVMNYYLASLPKKKLTIQQEIELLKRYKSGDKKAFDLLIYYNQKLIVKIVKSYLNRGVKFLDLLQEGNIGLIRAINKFDLSKGCKLSTYATCLINRKIQAYISENGRFIKIGYSNEYKLSHLNRVRNQLQLLYGEVDYEKLQKLTGFTEEEIIELDSLPNKVLSFNKPVNFDNCSDGEFVEEYNFDAEDDSYSIETESESNDLRRRLLRIMDDLNFSDRDKLIIYYHYGFVNNTVKTQEDVGKVLNLSKARIGQIIKAKLKELRHHINSTGELIDYYNPLDTYLYSPVSYWIEKILNVTENGKTLSNFREYYKRYGESNIDKMVERLSLQEQTLLFKLYGENLDEQNFNLLTDDEYKYFFEILVPKMTQIMRYLKNAKLYQRKVSI